MPTGIRLFFTASFTCLALAACGGGGGSTTSAAVVSADGNTTTTVTTATTTSTTLAAAYSAGTAATWERAQVFLPDTAEPATLDAIPGNARYPVAIFLHSCAGISGEEHDWARLLASEGLLVILPDSYARPGRPSNCGDISIHGGPHPEVHAWRQDEIDYAREQLASQSWFDGKTLFLMGYSEGAIAAVRSPRDGFTGVIATSWTCTDSESPALAGIALPSHTPLLTLMHEADSVCLVRRARIAGRLRPVHGRAR